MTKIGDITVTSITVNEDGSATVEFDMDQDSLRTLASIGILKVLSDAACGKYETLEAESNT